MRIKKYERQPMLSPNFMSFNAHKKNETIIRLNLIEKG